MDFSPRRPLQDITDDPEHRAASARPKFVSPMHEGVAPDELPDTLVAAQHALAPAIANLPTDSESTPHVPSASLEARANHRIALACSIVVILILGTLVSVSVLTR
jgi:hypothetical protein